jgi:putative addiction module component (TIGR02574 family)
MPFDISEIKSLSTQEKLRIIDEIWESINADKSFDEEAEESPEVIAMLEERVAKYERGEGKFYTEEVAKNILKDHLEAFRKGF